MPIKQVNEGAIVFAAANDLVSPSLDTGVVSHQIVIDADHWTPARFDRRATMYYSAGWQLLQKDIDDHANNQSPDGVNSRSQEVWGLRYIDDAMIRLLDKNFDGDCRDSGDLFWQFDPSAWVAQFSTVAVIDKNAVLCRRICSTSYGVGTHRWPHEVNNTGGEVIWGCSRSWSSRAEPRLGHATRRGEAS